MLTIPNVATSDKYTDACTLGPVALAERIVYVVANAAALCQIAGLRPDGTLGQWGDEFVLTPQSNIVQRAGGMRFRSAVAGVPAQVVAQLIQPDDPAPGAGTPFTAKLASSGGVTPGTSAVQIQKNGALIGTEVTIDFEDALGFLWTVADDPVNTRVKVTPPGATITKIGSVTGASAMSFAAIPQTYTHLMLVAALRCVGAIIQDTPLIRLNGDTVGPYDYQSVGASATAATGIEGIGTGYTAPVFMPGASAPANSMGLVVLIFPDYTSAAHRKGFIGLNYWKNADASGGQGVRFAGAERRVVGAITSIDISGNGSALDTSSMGTLYGLS